MPNNNIIDTQAAQVTAKRWRRMAKQRRQTKAHFNLKLWTKSTWERIRMSMFFSPMLAIMMAIATGFGMAYVDWWLNDQGMTPPIYITTNADSARSILSTIAGATIAFAGTAFSVSLLVLQLGSSQYSPRIVHTLFKDPFNRRIVALIMGTFTYCVVVMRSVDSPLSENEGNVVPNLSVALAFIMGIFSLLAIVAFIDHSASTMDISMLLEKVAQDTMVHIEYRWREDTDEGIDQYVENKGKVDGDDNGDDDDGNSSRHIEVQLKPKPDAVAVMEDAIYDFSKGEEPNRELPRDGSMGSKANLDMSPTVETHRGDTNSEEKMDDCYVVRFRTSGWVQEIDLDSLLLLVPPNGYIKLHTLAGRYAVPGSAVCSVFPKPQSLDADEINYSINLQSPDDSTEEFEEEEFAKEEFDLNVLDAIMLGYSRTIRSDATYGLRQLVDVVLKALSPGVNDPTTAQDGIFHIAAVVTEFLQRIPPKALFETENGGKLYSNEQQGYDRIVRLGFEEARVCAASSPMVALYLLEALRLIRESLTAAGRPDRSPEIERQARLVEKNIRNASHIQEDYDFVVKARRDRFDTNVTLESLGISGKMVA